MATTSNVQVNSSVGVDGNTYTTAVSNDKLSNDDFLKLMIQELKLQDPTKPMDSKEMLSTQMQMSQMNTNQEMISAMKSMQTAFTQSALSNASSIIGKDIEDGNVGKNGVTKAYTVRSVENVSGEIQVKAQEISYMEDQIIMPDPSDKTKNVLVSYNSAGEVLDSKGAKTGNKIVLTSPGKPAVDTNGQLTVLDANNAKVTNLNYSLAGVTSPVYASALTTLPFSNITKIF